MIPYLVAVLACCIAGAMGGYILARPQEALERRGLAGGDGALTGLAAARGFGAMLLMAHAGAAGMLGYYPSVGAAMALALALLWAGAAIGRLASHILDGQGDSASVQTLLVEAMMGLCLSLPFWAARQIAFTGPTVTV
ncbi:MAG: DUF4345 family protein [Pseudomonadota bacterium]